MVKMIRSAAPAQLGREFDDFLFSLIGEEPNGMSLSVVSALARSDVDPWREAAKLADLPQNVATERLAAMIGALPERLTGPLDVGTIAAGLIGLLPRPGVAAVGSHVSLLAGATTQTPTVKSVVIYAILLALVMGAESIMGAGPPLPQAHRTDASSPSVSGPQIGMRSIRE